MNNFLSFQIIQFKKDLSIPTMQLFKISSIMFLACAMQSVAAITAADCVIRRYKVRGRTFFMNPCFTQREYEYKVIQEHLNDPCSDQAKYWRSYYKYTGMSIPPAQRCISAAGVELRPNCISAGELKMMDRMTRCLAVKSDGICGNAFDLMIADEIFRLGNDAALDC